MRPGSEELQAALRSSVDLTFSADLWYGDERRISDLAIQSPSIDWDASTEVEGSGSLTVVWAGERGESLAPELPEDPLSPYGWRMVIFARVRAGELDERIQLGDFAITGVPRVDGQPVMFGSMYLYPGQLIEVTFKDRMVEVQRDRFAVPAQPSQTDSVYAELAQLTGLPLTRTLPDGGISRRVVYEESRVNAIITLASIIGGIPFMEWDGTLSLRPIVPGPPVAALEMGAEGTVMPVRPALSAEAVYNGVIITGESAADQQPFHYELWLTSGPLRATQPGEPRTPFHRVPRFYSSPFIDTLEKAINAAPALLERFSTPRAAELNVTCLVNPLLQVGDVVTVEDNAWLWTIRLTKVPLASAAVMTVTGDVIAREPR